MEAWMMDYNDQTAQTVEAMKQQARNAMWIQMGQSLATHGLEDPRALSGMSEAVRNYGQAANLGTAEYKQGREGSRLDMMRTMEQIRRSQQPSAPKRRIFDDMKLADGTSGVRQQDGNISYNGKLYTPEQWNEIALAAQDRENALKYNEKNRIASEESEAEIAGLMERGMSREDAETIQSIRGGKKAGPQREVTPPEQGVGEPPSAEEVRAIFEAAGDPRLSAAVAGMDDKQVVAFFIGLQ
jgi:hypothetical protein